MGGIAQYHFPRLVWKNGERRLWNPIQKKALKTRPEERVRLRIIDALAEMGWSKSRISTEESLRPSGEPGGRTDIICYDRNFSPKLLVECKAEHVPISPRVAEQTARYNRSVRAEYLLMSNGITDFWYHFPGPETIRRLEELPDFLKPPESRPKRPSSYWVERGFAGEKTASNHSTLLQRILNTFWFDMEGERSFLTFTESPTGVDLSHYYRIFGNEREADRTAVGWTDTPAGGTRLVAIFSRNRENRGVLETDLDLLFGSSEGANDTTLYNAGGSTKFNISEHGITQRFFSEPDSLAELPSVLDGLFDRFETDRA